MKEEMSNKLIRHQYREYVKWDEILILENEEMLNSTLYKGFDWYLSTGRLNVDSKFLLKFYFLVYTTN